jgi:tetratricopeptide (TPR) repeat protein
MHQPDDRILYLTELLQQDPEDPFLHYALCLERKKKGEDALQEFLSLLKKFPEYLPAYYQTAVYQAETGHTEAAAETAALGIMLSEKQKDLHALAELKGLRQNILAGEYD